MISQSYHRLDTQARVVLLRETGLDSLAELDAQFLLDVEFLLLALQEAAETGDITLLRQTIHTLRGAASSLGYIDIMEMTDELRLAYGQGHVDASVWRPTLDLLIDTCRSMVGYPIEN